jgi:cytidylate kinase
MAVVTVSREFGTSGERIATDAARALGYHVADRDVIERVLRQYGLVELDDVEGGVPSFWIYFDEQLRLTAEMLVDTIRALARHGNVVVLGRGSYAVLHGLADVLNVRVEAPLSWRVQHVTADERLSLAEAEARVAQADRERAGFVERVFGARWEDARTFDLVVNLGSVAPDLATRLIVEAARAVDGQPPAGRPRATDLPVSPTLASVIDEVLECEVRHG